MTFVFRNMLRRKIRSALTIAGAAVAVTAMVALVGISQGFESSFAQIYETRGVDIMVLEKGKPQKITSKIPEEVGVKIKGMQGVKDVVGGYLEIISLDDVAGFPTPLNGWPLGSLLFKELNMVEGRNLQTDDVKSVIVGKTLALQLKSPGGGPLRVGDPLMIEQEKFTVVGIFESFNVYENGSVIAPIGIVQELMGVPGYVTGYSVLMDKQTSTTQSIKELCSRIEALTDVEGKLYNLDADPTMDYVSSTQEIKYAKGMAWMTSTIALVIGTIGVLNTMLMLVMERTREIGILRAIGWRPRKVVQMILSESLMLSIAGAVVGTAAGVLLARLLAQLPAASGFIEGKVSWEVILQGMLVGVLVGIGGGLYPAIRASRLLPTEAIRHE